MLINKLGINNKLRLHIYLHVKGNSPVYSAAHSYGVVKVFKGAFWYFAVLG